MLSRDKQEAQYHYNNLALLRHSHCMADYVVMTSAAATQAKSLIQFGFY